MKKKKKEAISTAELLQRFWTCFQGNWRLCGSVVEAVQRPLWVDWFSCLFGPYNWLGHTQAHVHSHTNTINVSLKRRHKGKSPFSTGKKEGQTGSLCFVIPGCLCSLVFLSCIVIIRLASDRYTGPQGLWEILAAGELKWCCYVRSWAEVVPLTWMQSKTLDWPSPSVWTKTLALMRWINLTCMSFKLWKSMLWVHPMSRSHSVSYLISQDVLPWTACQTFSLPSLPKPWSMLCKYMLYRR